MQLTRTAQKPQHLHATPITYPLPPTYTMRENVASVKHTSEPRASAHTACGRHLPLQLQIVVAAESNPNHLEADASQQGEGEESTRDGKDLF